MKNLNNYPCFKDSGKLIHRWKAEKMLCRKLLHGEVVHHRDGDKQNFRQDNLQVFCSQEAHLLHHLNALLLTGDWHGRCGWKNINSINIKND